MCQKCGDELSAFLKDDPLPISGVCLCAPDFVMMFRVKGEGRWVVGRRICDMTTDVDGEIEINEPLISELSNQDVLEFLAGNYDAWSMMCLHCGMTYAEGVTS